MRGGDQHTGHECLREHQVRPCHPIIRIRLRGVCLRQNSVDKVSFAGIFSKLFHPLTLPLSPNLGRGRGEGKSLMDLARLCW
jgi:hypothetical protein